MKALHYYLGGMAGIQFTFIVGLFFIHTTSFSQTAPNAVWRDIAKTSIADATDRDIVPERYRTLELDKDALLDLLAQVPAEYGVLSGNVLILSLPLPDGTFAGFRVLESPIMAPELAARYPEIRTYIGQGVDDPRSSVRLDWTQFGFHAIIFSPKGTVYIDPFSRSTTRYYISYFKRDLLPAEARPMHEIGPLGTDSETAREIRRLVAQGVPRSISIGEELRTYRLALATTGEYTVFHGGTVAAGMAAITTAMNRVNGIYEREVSVRMVLIANNDTLVYTNGATDPYTNDDAFTMLAQNQANLDSVIGDANYDVGHVFSTGGGGVAFLGVPCRSGLKAGGVTGLSAPIGDPFYVDYVAHEMGHQFGGNHTFNGNASNCAGGNRNPSTAYEPGSGTTIMAYAGICGSQNIQNQSDDYFHGISIDEIIAYTQLGSGNSCPTISVTGNNVPSANAGGIIYTIPIETPFMLSGSGSDPNGDSLTFGWEEFDLGPTGHPNSPIGNAPIFRSFDPTTLPSRMFPQLSDILGGRQTIGEILPSYSRTLNFRLTARDNRMGGGGVGHDMTSVTVTETAGPFEVTYPNTTVAWLTNSTDSVTWNVANTNASPVNCTSVNILLSIDGGETFSDTLASNSPNDGSESIAVPGNYVANARVRVEAIGNIFFDIGDADFVISNLTTPVLASPANNGTNQPTSLDVVWNEVPLATTYHVQVSIHIGFVFGVVVNDSTVTDTTRNVTGLEEGRTYYWRVRAKNNEGLSIWSPIWSFTTISLPSQVALLSPANQATISTDSALFQWNGQSVVDRYWFEYATDSTFTSSIIDSILTDTTTTVHGLQNNQTYWWRVRGQNTLGWGPFSAVRSFSVIITSVPQAARLPDKFRLQQNYPNPFNPSTQIQFALPKASHVKLRIYNALGELLTTLIDETRQAGYYSERFNATGLASGLYFYRLQAGDFVDTKKLLLLK